MIEGRQPASLTRTRLARTKALPLDWSAQRRLLGFARCLIPGFDGALFTVSWKEALRARYSRGGLFHLLSNPVYVGEVHHKGEVHAGQHDAIVDRALWDQVQAALADKAPARTRRANIQYPSLLAGLAYDGHGRRMTPSHAVKKAKRYRYYMTQHVERDGPTAWRVPAHDFEQLVIARLCRHLAEPRTAETMALHDHDDHRRQAAATIATLLDAPEQERARCVAELVARIDLRREEIEIVLHSKNDEQDTPTVLHAAATLIRSGRQTRLVLPGVQPEANARRDEALIRLVATAHAARKAIMAADDKTFAEVAADQGYTGHYFSQLVRLGGLAPDIVAAVIEGRQPASLTRTRLARTKALPLDWNAQRRLLGFG